MGQLRVWLAIELLAAVLVGYAPRQAPPSPRRQAQVEQLVHVVQEGENLFRLALRYETTVDAIVMANGLADEHTIYIGQQLVIPRAMGRSATPGQPATGGNSYIVQWGDTLHRIALRHNITVWSLMQANGLASYMIYQGQRLVIPDSAAPTPPGQSTASTPTADSIQPTASPQPAPEGVATQPPVSPTSQATWPATGTPQAGPGITVTLQPGSPTPTPTSQPPGLSPSGTYVVRPGDTLYSIARRFDTTVAALAYLNEIADAATIYAGQELRVSGAVPALPAPSGSGGGYAGGKHIVVDLSEQHLYAYSGNQLVYSFVASTGAAPTYTRAGEFRVQSKIPSAYGSTWNIWMPHWLGIYWAGSTENGIHALPILPSGQTLWAGYLGRPISYGCVVLGTYEASLLYNWAEIGTPVSIRY